MKNSFRSFIVLFATIILIINLSSCTKKKTISCINPQIDSLLSSARDSFHYNNKFAKQNILKALKLAKDSNEYYYAYSDYANFYYIAVGAYDTVNVMIDKLISHANRQTAMSVPAYSIYVNAYNLRGNYYSQLCKLDSAIHYYTLALKYGKLSSEPQKMPDIIVNLADMNTRKGEYVKGISYYRQALALSDSLHLIKENGFSIYFGLGQTYFMGLRNYELSDLYFRKAEKLYANRTLAEKFIFCNNRGNFYYYKEEYVKALPWFRKAKALVLPSNNEYYINLCHGNLGDIFLNINVLDSAEYYTNKAYDYFYAIKNEDVIYYLQTVKAGIALKRKQETKAFTYLSAPTTLQHIEPLFLGIRNKYLQEYYEQTGNYAKAYVYLKNNTRQNDSLRTERMNNRIAEIDMRFRQDTARIRQDVVISKQSAKINTLQMANIMWAALSVVIIIAGLFIFLYLTKKRALQRAKLADMNSKLRLQNIRNRISPHFIFNVLNRERSSEEDEAKHHQMIGLVKFLRRSLEITEKTAVTLADEIEFVKNYLQIEQSSLGGDFLVEWSVDSLVDQEWLIPAMIIQIPVENAVKHALRQKEGEKRLTISILKKNQHILISISDNGEGYHPEKVLTSKGTSTGLKVLYQSIDLLNSKNTNHIRFSISDIKDNLSTGTRVDISIPQHYIFD